MVNSVEFEGKVKSIADKSWNGDGVFLVVEGLAPRGKKVCLTCRIDEADRSLMYGVQRYCMVRIKGFMEEQTWVTENGRWRSKNIVSCTELVTLD